MLKWITDADTPRETLHILWHDNGMRLDATPADIIACLGANPEACEEVLRALLAALPPERVAEMVPRDTGRVDRLRAALRDTVRRLGNGSNVTASVSDQFLCQVPTEVGIVVDRLRAGRDAALAAAEAAEGRAARMRDERDSTQAALVTARRESSAALARVAEVERERDAADERGSLVGDILCMALGPNHGRGNEVVHAQKASDRIASLTARLAAAEAVVEAVREAMRLREGGKASEWSASLDGCENALRAFDELSGTTRREPPESARMGASTGAVADTLRRLRDDPDFVASIDAAAKEMAERFRRPRTQRDPFEHRCSGVTPADLAAAIDELRSEIVGACSTAIVRFKAGRYQHELAALAAELRKPKESKP